MSDMRYDRGNERSHFIVSLVGSRLCDLEYREGSEGSWRWGADLAPSPTELKQHSPQELAVGRMLARL